MNTDEKKELELLREKFGRHKTIPKKYEKPILLALSHYPELENVSINFKLKDKHVVPYGTRPTIGSLIKKPSSRKYIITIREKAEHPMYLALFKNLPNQARVGVIGHELAHIVQFNSGGKTKLVKMLFEYLQPASQRKIEREADRLTIEHGLGMELYAHAAFIRSIPGYTEERKEINKNYLKPSEILEALAITR